jgi:hypothetical protein
MTGDTPICYRASFVLTRLPAALRTDVRWIIHSGSYVIAHGRYHFMATRNTHRVSVCPLMSRLKKLGIQASMTWLVAG